MSLVDAAGRPATHAPGQPMDLSKPAQQFFAGVLHHMPSICAITAPSPVSYLRLVPNAWAPTVIDLVRQDRGASLRICPVFAAATPDEVTRQFHVEFRVTDASASPYLALGAVIFAGADGIRRALPLAATGSTPASLPRSLPDARQYCRRTCARSFAVRTSPRWESRAASCPTALRRWSSVLPRTSCGMPKPRSAPAGAASQMVVERGDSRRSTGGTQNSDRGARRGGSRTKPASDGERPWICPASTPR